MNSVKALCLLACLALLPSLGLSQSLDELEQRLKREQAAEQKRKAAEARREASMGTLVVRVDRNCVLSVNGESQGEMVAGQTQSVRVAAGEHLLECEASDDGRVERVVRVEAASQKVLRLEVPVRFEVVSNGVRDRVQGVIWSARDNGRDVSWQQAQAYCAGLGAGWSLPSVAQLQSLYDSAGAFARQVSSLTIKPATEKVGVTGWRYWSAELNGSAEAWNVGLGYGSRDLYHVSASNLMRALCVRRP